jgi:hypothetical protein
MDSFDPKELKKLAEACRKAGISSFKGYGVEFTLSEAIPPKKARKRSQKASTSLYDGLPDDIKSELPTEEELLFYSAGGVPVPENEQ